MKLVCRYETNVIVPPIFAGTYHLSPFTSREDMIGGDFRANIKGLDHYQQFGYKGINMIIHIHIQYYYIYIIVFFFH